MRYMIILLAMLLGPIVPANAQVSIGIGVPGLSIGINMPVYPEFQRVPSYPVYYAPQVGFNLFFYDGMYWAYQNDNWYASSWYNGPWGLVSPMYVPFYVLRVPVRYYRRPPPYFRGWSYDEPPRWGQHYGKHWEQERNGWNTWNRNSAPPPAPLPVYQRQYSGSKYPQVQQQPAIRGQYYHYQPSDPVVRQHYEQEEVHAKQQPQQHSQSQQQGQQQPKQQQQPHAQPQQQGQHPQQQQGAPKGEPQSPGSGHDNASQGQGKGAAKGSKSGQGPEEDAGKGENNGQGHND